MQAYFETYEYIKSGNPLETDGIDLKGSCTAVAHATLEDAIQYADAHGCDIICEIFGNWNEFKKCWFCEEWFNSNDLIGTGVCHKCARAITDHEHH